jgi:hypothetical protein
MHTPSTLARTVQGVLLAVVAGASVTALEAQSHEFATVIELDGRVSVLRNGQVALFPNSTVAAKEEIVTGPDGHAVFQIRDGSTFEVFPNSRVTFQGQWTVEDMLQLLLGKIRVTIEHRNGPNNKKISTPTAVISVRGTTFDVAVEDDDGTTLVSVEEGQVLVRHLLQPGPAVVVEEGKSVRIFPNQPLAKVPSSSPGVKYVYDRVVGVVADLVLRGPGGIGSSGGGIPAGAGGPQGNRGKKKKDPPTTAPPPGGGL